MEHCRFNLSDFCHTDDVTICCKPNLTITRYVPIQTNELCSYPILRDFVTNTKVQCIKGLGCIQDIPCLPFIHSETHESYIEFNIDTNELFTGAVAFLHDPIEISEHLSKFKKLPEPFRVSHLRTTDICTTVFFDLEMVSNAAETIREISEFLCVSPEHTSDFSKVILTNFSDYKLTHLECQHKHGKEPIFNLGLSRLEIRDDADLSTLEPIELRILLYMSSLFSTTK